MTDHGGHLVSPELMDAVYTGLMKRQVWMPISDELWEDMGYPPRAKGLAYWQRRERDAVAAAHPAARLRRRWQRLSRFAADVPRRLTNARAALSGEWERSDDE